MKIPLVPLALLLLPVLGAAQASAPDLSSNPAADNRPVDPTLPTLFVVGDSTAAKGSENAMGWAVPFADYFDPAKINVVNLARGGRSSRTYITEGLWDKAVAQFKTGDTVLIQFGQLDGDSVNEEPPGSTRPLRARGSLPGLGEETREIDNVVTKQREVVHTYGWYLRKMMAEVKAKGATPIVLSHTARHLWKDGKVERGNGRYRQWSREIAASAGVQFLDITRLIADEYQRRGEAAVKELFPKDWVHTGLAGADLNASLVVAALKGIRKGPWAGYLSAKGQAVEADDIGWLNLPEPADPKQPSLFLIGDSTVRNGGGDGAGGQWGWGDFLAPYFDPARLNLVNRAVGGTTARSFLSLGYWERALMLMKAGDILLIQFGTNDSSPINEDVSVPPEKRRSRGSLPGLGEETKEIDNIVTGKHEVVHTNGWYLRKFVREARAAGVTPVLCSLVPRKIWKDGKIGRSTTSAVWAREVAEREGIGFIDLNNLIAARYEELGEAKVNELFADEHTHTSRAGAEVNAGIVAAAVRQLPGDPLGAFAQ